MKKIAVLVMSYGTPQNLEELPVYYKNIRRGREPSKTEIEELRNRYLQIGGVSPLGEISARQAGILGQLLGANYKVFSAFKFIGCSIGETLEAIKRNGYKKLIAINLTPFASDFANNTYFDEVKRELRGNNIEVSYVQGWSEIEKFLNYWVETIREELASIPREELDTIKVIFTAHSVPKKIIQAGDTYEISILQAVSKISSQLGIRDYVLGWQSAGKSGDWLEPSVEDRIRESKLENKKSVLLVPIGFISEHLEILYDLDICMKSLCRDLQMAYRRTVMPNDNKYFIEAMVRKIQNEVS